MTAPEDVPALERAIAAIEGQRAVLGDQVTDTALAPLVGTRDRLLAVSVGEQRKLVTVLFADLVDSTELAGRLDPEDLQEVMGRYFAVVRSAVEAGGGAVEAGGGVVERFIGGAVMAGFGLYRAREDDAARAVRAALAIHAGVQRLGAQVTATHRVPLRVRVGVDTGEVVVTGTGAADGEVLAVGETMDRAARLQAAADPGTVLVSAEAVRQVRGLFGLRRRTGLRLKGIAGPVATAVAAVAAAPTR